MALFGDGTNELTQILLCSIAPELATYPSIRPGSGVENWGVPYRVRLRPSVYISLRNLHFPPVGDSIKSLNLEKSSDVPARGGATCATDAVTSFDAGVHIWTRVLPSSNGNVVANTGKSQMLILTRRVGESVMIGDDVIVTVMGVKGNQVRVGISAPKDVEVHREEIFERIKLERKGKTEAQLQSVTPNAA